MTTPTRGDTRSRPLRLVEALAVGVGAAATGAVAGSVVGIGWWPGVISGVNGLISGYFGVYDWRCAKGWWAALLDSTWGLLGTTQAIILHAVNLLVPRSDYVESESHRRNRHVYDRGVRIRGPFALAAGNVISNGGGLVGLIGESPAIDRRRRFITAHEELHVWQSRVLGPVFQLLYLLWMAVGAAVGAVLCLIKGATFRSAVETVAYYNNPFEYWAYRRDDYWPPSGADPGIAWGARRRRFGSDSHDHHH